MTDALSGARTFLLMLTAAGMLAFGQTLCCQPSSFAEETLVQVKLASSRGEALYVTGTRSEIYDRAEQFSNSGDYTYAQLCYERLIETDQRDVRAYLLLGKMYQHELEKLPKAINCFKKAAQLVPSSNKGGRALCERLCAEAYRSLAEKSNSLIYFVQAIGEYEKVLDYDPHDAEVMYYLATCRLNTNDFETAIALYEKVMLESPKSEWADYSKKAVVYARKARGRLDNETGRGRRGSNRASS